jgi:hypothetical protein
MIGLLKGKVCQGGEEIIKQIRTVREFLHYLTGLLDYHLQTWVRGK